MEKPGRLQTITTPRLIGIIILLCLLIIAAGYGFYLNESNILRNEKLTELKAISELKIKQISEWYQDNLNDSKVISQNIFLNDRISEWLHNNDNQSKAKLFEYLKSI